MYRTNLGYRLSMLPPLTKVLTYGWLCLYGFILTVVLSVSPVHGSNIIWIAPHLENMGATHATLVWNTNIPVKGELQVKLPSGQVKSIPAKSESLAGKWQYVAVVDGLLPETCYSYRVLAGDQEITATGTSFCTSARPGTPFTFAAFGDSGTGNKSQANLAVQMMRDHKDGTPLSFLMHVGDIAYPKGTFTEFTQYHFAVYKPLLQLMPLYPTPGNHEYYTNNADPYFKLHVLPTAGVLAQDFERYYSFDWGDAHFVSIDTNYGSPVASTRFRTWLEKDLAATTARWRIVFFHVPAYSSGKHGPTELAKSIVPLLEKAGVDLAVQGHDHNVQRTVPLLHGKPATANEKGITYIVTGAGSAASYSCSSASWLAYKLCGVTTPVYTRVSVTPNALTVEQVRDTGAVLDKVVIPHR